MTILCGGTIRVPAPRDPPFGFGTGVVVIGEIELGVDVEVLGRVEPEATVVGFDELVVGNDSLFEPPVVLNVLPDVVGFILLLATSCLNGSPKLCA